MNKKKKDIQGTAVKRVYVVYFFVLLLGLTVVGKAAFLQVKGGDAKGVAIVNNTSIREVEPTRGNIYSAEGSLLATSMPFYEMRMDMAAEGLTDTLFKSNVVSLAEKLHEVFGEKSAAAYQKDLQKGRAKKSRWHLLHRKANHIQYKKMMAHPLLKRGRYKSGLVVVKTDERRRPFGVLASRTIGSRKPVGIEGAYDKELRGEPGQKLFKRIDGRWMPVESAETEEAIDGADVYSTILVDLQDVAEEALVTQMQKHKADKGCAVLMEVETGKIRAIANIKMDSLGKFYEALNYAVMDCGEPGSTMKLASMIALLEDNAVKLTDTIDTFNGVKKYYDRKIRDSKWGGYGKITALDVFEKSSNIGIMEMVNKQYKKTPERFVSRLLNMGLGKQLGLELKGEGTPRIKSPADRDWYGTTMLWSSIGYEVGISPMQMLAFYNAVANTGEMVRPQFVDKVMHNGEVVKSFQKEVLNPSICSMETLQKVQGLLEGVVEKGTATNLKNDQYSIAGKTGTTQINYWKKGDKQYKASFAGYFPADAPKYSCIVSVTGPKGGSYYGSEIAAPVFKKIADKVYALNVGKDTKRSQRLFADEDANKLKVKGASEDVKCLVDNGLMPESIQDIGSDWVNQDDAELESIRIENKVMPETRGMGLRDALYLLESQGLKVQVSGIGRVVKQSIKAGQKLQEGQTIKLTLA